MEENYFHFLLKLAHTKNEWEHRSVEDIEATIKHKKKGYCKFGYHIRSRIDLYNFCQHIYESTQDNAAIIYIPLNISDQTQHKYCLLFLAYLENFGIKVYLPYKDSINLHANKLMTSTADTIIKQYMISGNIIAGEVVRYVYSAGKSKGSFAEISREYHYSRIYYGRVSEAKGLLNCGLDVLKLIPNKYSLIDTLKSEIRTHLDHEITIGWFPSIKECAIIDESIISILTRLSKNVNIIIGVHPMLKERNPNKHKILQRINYKNLGIIYTELIDSSLLAACCDVLVGDVGSIIWDSMELSIPLVLLRNGSRLEYDNLLLTNRCYYEWYIGNKLGRHASINLNKAISLQLTQLKLSKKMLAPKTTSNAEAIDLIKQSCSYISSYTRELDNGFKTPHDYDTSKVNQLISMLVNFEKRNKILIDQSSKMVVDIVINDRYKLEAIIKNEAIWQELYIELERKLTEDDYSMLYDTLIWGYEHYGMWLSPAVGLFTAKFILCRDEDLKTKYFWLKRSIFASICYINPKSKYVNYTEKLYKNSITLLQGTNSLFHYRKLAAFYKSYGYQLTKLPRLLMFMNDFVYRMIEELTNTNNRIKLVLGMESRQFAFEIMEICSILPLEGKKREFIQEHIVFMLDESYAANIKILKEFCEINSIQSITPKCLLEKIQQSSKDWLVLDQYCLTGLYKWLNPDKKRLLLSHSLISSVDKLLDNLEKEKSSDIIKQRSNQALFTLQKARLLIVLCFKDIFRPHHSSEVFMHYRKSELCPKEYISKFLNIVKEQWSEAIFFSANDYEHDNVDINIISYKELDENKNTARYMTLEMVSKHKRVIVLGDGNGSFDVHAQIADFAIRIGPENSYIQNLDIFKQEREDLLPKSIDNISKELHTRKCIDSARKSGGEVLISGAHSTVIENTTEPEQEHKIYNEFRKLLIEIHHTLN